MSKRSRPPPDPDTMKPEDFEDPFEVFFWLGYFAGSRAKSQKHDNPPTEKNVSTSDTPVENDKKKPMCEIAEFCVYDTETSGLSCRDCAVQVAVGFFDADARPLGYYDRLWKLPPGIKVSSGSYRIHKISDKRIHEEGYEAAPELRNLKHMFDVMLKRGKRIVAHNKAFDVRILAQSARQHGVDEWSLKPSQVLCTMQRSKAFCSLKAKDGKPKAPSNSELYKILTGSTPNVPLHDAGADIRVTARSYIEGMRRGWW